jgi:GNAT superfamily N-acetyltransferase
MNELPIVIRAITLEDAELIAHQRYRMFVDDGVPDNETTRDRIQAFLPWVKARIQFGTYTGWFALHGDTVVAGVGMMMLDWPPHDLHAEPLRGYVLNVYTEPGYRGRGIAKRLMQQIMQEAKARQITVVTLHASKMGRPIYEKLGFQSTSEMRWISTESV